VIRMILVSVKLEGNEDEANEDLTSDVGSVGK
jgi:hypothetical protein